MDSSTDVTPLYRHSEEIHRTRAWQAAQIWVILVGCAAHKTTIEYGELAVKMGYGKRAANTLSDALDHVYALCMTYDLPLLTVLIEGVESGRPNTSHELYQDPAAERRRVWRYNWYDIIAPPAVSFSECYRVYWS